MVMGNFWRTHEPARSWEEESFFVMEGKRNFQRYFLRLGKNKIQLPIDS